MVIDGCYLLEDEGSRLIINPGDQTWTLRDRRSDQCWGQTEPHQPWLMHTPMPVLPLPPPGAKPPETKIPKRPEPIPLYLESARQDEGAIYTRFASQQGSSHPFTIVWRLVAGALQVYVVPDPGQTMPSLEVCCSGLLADQVLLPVRMGLLLHGDAEQAFDHEFGTYDYEGVHMAMCGLLSSGSVLMATWGDPSISLHMWRDLSMPAPGRLRTAFRLRDTARSFELRCLGSGDLFTLATAYRQRAEELGYRQTWAQKIARQPKAAKLIGACNFKLWTALVRKVDDNLNETEVSVYWTFDEAAQIAEHLRHDVQIDDVLFHLGGWTRYGYDCRHPDIMPPNPECGGESGLVDCARRVQACGYLFCLHDNYQDMYRDAPSWDEACLEKKPDGSPVIGGVWLGGRAYYTCAREALKLAKRPENLPAVQHAIAPDIYFIDTTYAVGPQTCSDPRHPLTRQEDIAYKAELSDYARDAIGLFGSECGREWALPHADFFEGLMSVSGRYYHFPRLEPDSCGGSVVPFFEMVYRDCIALHGKYEHDLTKTAEQVLHHALMGRPLYYHFHQTHHHLYWQDAEKLRELPEAAGILDVGAFTRAHNGWAEGMCLADRYMKNTQEILGPLHKLTAQTLVERFEFLDAARLARQTTFGNGVKVVVNFGHESVSVLSEAGGEVLLPPFGLLVESPTFVAFRALSWDGILYSAPVLFTLTSLDGRTLTESTNVRVFHGHGDARIMVRGRCYDVKREAVI
ncbi:MAG: DUF5696 domain-containing protein [Anaerolineae bacterium]